MRVDGRNILCTITLVMLTLACATKRLNHTPDSWYRAPKAGLFSASQNTLDSSRFASVDQHEEVKAEHALENYPFLEIQPREATSAAGNVDIIHTGCRYFLLRGLEYAGGSGAFQLYKVNGSIIVAHAALGRHSLPIKKRAVVACLDEPPDEVFITIGMAE